MDIVASAVCPPGLGTGTRGRWSSTGLPSLKCPRRKGLSSVYRGVRWLAEMRDIRTQPLTGERQTQTTVLPVSSPKMTDTNHGGNVREGGIFLRWWECKLAKPLPGSVGLRRQSRVGAHALGSAAWAAAGCAVRTLVAMELSDGMAPTFPLLSRPSLAEVSKLWDYSPNPACHLLLFLVLQHSHVIC